MKYIINFIVTRPAATLMSALLLCIVAALGSYKLNLSTDYRLYFSDDNPQLRDFSQMESTFSRNDNVFFVLAPKDGKLFTNQNIEAIKWLTEESWQLPYSIRVDSISNYQHSHSHDDDLEVGDLLPSQPVSLSSKELEQYEAIAVNEPLLINRLINSNATVTGVNVRFQLPGIHNNTELAEVADAAYVLRNQFLEQYPEFDVYLTGFIIMNYAMPKASQDDMVQLFPLMLLAITLVVFGLFRCWKTTAVLMGTLLIIIGSAMGLAGWMGIVLTPPTMAAPVVILTLAVADSVHILLGYRKSYGVSENKVEAMKNSLTSNLRPVFLTTLTTSLGFLSMNMSDSPPFRDLGNIISSGIWVAMLLSITLLPSIMMFVNTKNSSGKGVDELGSLYFRQLARWIYQHAKMMLLLNAVLITVLVAFISRNELNDEFVKYVSEEVDFRKSTEFAASNLSGIYTMEYKLDSGEPNGISAPDYLAEVELFTEWLRDQPEIVHVASLVDILKRLNMNMHDDDPLFYKLPTDKAETSQYLLLFEMSLPAGLDLTDQINLDKSAIRVIVTLKDNYSTNEFLQLEQRADSWMSKHTPALRSLPSSPTMMFTHIGKRNINSMLISTVMALALISGLLVVTFKSLRLGLLSMLPNIAPGLMGFGLWGLINGQVGLALSMVASLTMGIVVDNTIHFISKYKLYRHEQNLSIEETLSETFERLGLVVFATNVILISGFAILVFSDFTPNGDMGLLTCITLAFALFTDLLLLPALLIMFDHPNLKAKTPECHQTVKGS